MNLATRQFSPDVVTRHRRVNWPCRMFFFVSRFSSI